MWWRFANLLVALQVTVAVCAIVPAHRHAAEGGAEHAAHSALESDADHDERGHEPDGHDSAYCSVCLFASAVATPLRAGQEVGRPDEVGTGPAAAARVVVHLSFVATLHGRAPPAPC